MALDLNLFGTCVMVGESDGIPMTSCGGSDEYRRAAPTSCSGERDHRGPPTVRLAVAAGPALAVTAPGPAATQDAARGPQRTAQLLMYLCSKTRMTCRPRPAPFRDMPV